MTKIYKVEMVVVVHNGDTYEDMISSINRRVSQHIVTTSQEGYDVDDWTDDNPMNMTACTKEEAITEFERVKALNN